MSNALRTMAIDVRPHASCPNSCLPEALPRNYVASGCCGATETRSRVKADGGRDTVHLHGWDWQSQHGYATRTEGSPPAAASASARCLRPSNMRRVMRNPGGSIASVSSRAQTVLARTWLRDTSCVRVPSRG